MKEIGGAMFFFGVGSMVLFFLNMEFILLMWVDLWGLEVGWMIRIALAVIGGLLWLVGQAQESTSGAPASRTEIAD